jgi:hypothetical protein
VPGCAMRFVRIGSAVAVAVAGAAVTAVPAAAEQGVMHNVTYSVFTEQPFRAAEIYYRDTDPPSWADYSHDPYLFSPNVEADLGPTQQWTLNVQLANPDEWAMVMVTSGTSKFPPNFHCVLAVDGVVVSQNSGAKGALCSLRHW